MQVYMKHISFKLDILETKQKRQGIKESNSCLIEIISNQGSNTPFHCHRKACQNLEEHYILTFKLQIKHFDLLPRDKKLVFMCGS